MERRDAVVVLARRLVDLANQARRRREQRDLEHVLRPANVEEHAVDVPLKCSQRSRRRVGGVGQLGPQHLHELHVLVAQKLCGGRKITFPKVSREPLLLAKLAHEIHTRACHWQEKLALVLFKRAGGRPEVNHLNALVATAASGRSAALPLIPWPLAPIRHGSKGDDGMRAPAGMISGKEIIDGFHTDSLHSSNLHTMDQFFLAHPVEHKIPQLVQHHPPPWCHPHSCSLSHTVWGGSAAVVEEVVETHQSRCSR